jgi:hypothetical protein
MMGKFFFLSLSLSLPLFLSLSSLIIKINWMSCTDEFNATWKLREVEREKKRGREGKRKRERTRTESFGDQVRLGVK